MAVSNVVPKYHLYGEGDGVEDFDFFHIETIPARSAPLGWMLEPHRHDHLIQILMPTAGHGWLKDDNGEHETTAGMAILTPPGVMHGWRFSPDTQGYVVSVTRDYLSEQGAEPAALCASDLHGTANRLVTPDPADRAHAERYLAEMAAEFDHGPQRRSIFRPLLTLFLVRLFADKPGHAMPDGARGFSLFQFRSLVEQHFKAERQPEFYANAMGLSLSRLNRYCRLFIGKTAAQALRERMILEAKRQLAFSDFSVSQIAYDLGFDDPAYFSRVFRKETGVSPLDFRLQQHPQR
ncbi:AraC family transcriptional activator of pobA [Roseibium hamelinense]|uniref:AraC family transcriptional activator of pobA n=1 Tax=Roseibium hamelinense TaxID=150831 RepID=A0A562T7T0_9HYPH|nr:helix-turn-helix domain-containing protein [Roseibium hamelinense]MTI43510.1 helix-turn-helix domain-containing protein [Roseibium hamelinense]TWI89697.1 AraC family transcriptional activator of pobA [Roseibium hamelinense]